MSSSARPWKGNPCLPTYYRQPQQEEMHEQRLERTWFGRGADIKLRALDKAQELSATWN